MDTELSAPVVVFTLLPRSYLLRIASYFALKLLWWKRQSGIGFM